MVTRVFIADGKTEERSALRLLILDLKTSALDELRRACSVRWSSFSSASWTPVSKLPSLGADAFISKGETPDRVAERLRAVAASVRT